MTGTPQGTPSSPIDSDMPQDGIAFVLAFLDAPDGDAGDSLTQHHRLATSFGRLSELADVAVSLNVEVECTLVPAPLVQLHFSADAEDAPQYKLDELAARSGMRLIALCENDDGQFWALRSHTSPLASRDADGWIVATPRAAVLRDRAQRTARGGGSSGRVARQSGKRPSPGLSQAHQSSQTPPYRR
jgi:hypothetical protein